MNYFLAKIKHVLKQWYWSKAVKTHWINILKKTYNKQHRVVIFSHSHWFQWTRWINITIYVIKHNTVFKYIYLNWPLETENQKWRLIFEPTDIMLNTEICDIWGAIFHQKTKWPLRHLNFERMISGSWHGRKNQGARGARTP